MFLVDAACAPPDRQRGGEALDQRRACGGVGADEPLSASAGRTLTISEKSGERSMPAVMYMIARLTTST